MGQLYVNQQISFEITFYWTTSMCETVESARSDVGNVYRDEQGDKLIWVSDTQVKFSLASAHEVIRQKGQQLIGINRYGVTMCTQN